MASSTSDRGRFFAGNNDNVGFFGIIRIGDQAVQSPTISLSQEGSDQGVVSGLRVYRLQAVAIGRLPGWHLRTIEPTRRSASSYDVLIPVEAPVGGLAGIVPPFSELLLFGEFDVADGAPTGTYTFSLELHAVGKLLARVPVCLTVWPVRVPDAGEVTAIVDVDHRKLFSAHPPNPLDQLNVAIDDWRDHAHRAELDSLLAETLEDLRRHGLTPGLPRLSPKVRVASGGNLELDWTAYDITVRPQLLQVMTETTRAKQTWPMPMEPIAEYLRLSTSSHNGDRLAREYVSGCIDHFLSEGWFQRSIAAMPIAVAPGTDAAENSIRFFELIRSIDRRATLVNTLMPQDMKPLGWTGFRNVDFGSTVDIWSPAAQFFDRDALRVGRSKNPVWVRPDRPPFSGSLSYMAPATHARILTWQAQQLGAEALQLGIVNDWPVNPATANPKTCLEHDNQVLLYPGGPFGLRRPVPSLRLKMLREGLRDASLCRALRESGRDHIRTSLVQALVSYCGADACHTSYADGRPNGWVDDWNALESARRIMFSELVAARGPVESVGSDVNVAVRAQFDWRGLMTTGRRKELLLNGTRVRIGGGSTDAAFQMETGTTLWNGSRSLWSPRIGLDFPDNWPGFLNEPVMADVPVNGFRHVVLLAQASSIPWENGAMPKVFIEDEDGGRRFDLRVPFISAIRSAKPLRIDGDLSDWPPGGANVALDFALITPATELADRKPTLSSLAFVMRDEQNLYIAVNCALAGPLSDSLSTRKTVTYDDLVPVGDELVDILFDPLNAGTRTPTDLYHITVKCRGPASADRGLNVEPPVGDYAPWAANFDSAVRVTDDRWTAEVRIPLAAFPNGRTGREVWGFNVARFDTRNQEFSSWSGAIGNVYDPLSLGNLYLP